MNKTALGVYAGPRGHWVGEGFPVRSLFDYQVSPLGLAVRPPAKQV
jgi:hypothetical protein